MGRIYEAEGLGCAHAQKHAGAWKCIIRLVHGELCMLQKDVWILVFFGCKSEAIVDFKAKK